MNEMQMILMLTQGAVLTTAVGATLYAWYNAKELKKALKAVNDCNTSIIQDFEAIRNKVNTHEMKLSNAAGYRTRNI